MRYSERRGRVRTCCVAHLLCVGVWSLTLGCSPASEPDTGVAALQTRPERTSFRETSRYDDVMAFLNAASRASRRLHLATFGYSFEGRALPLVVIGNVPDATAASVQAAGTTRVFVLAGTAGGEVDGKEATLSLVRALASGAFSGWDNSLVVLVAPLFNPDGNERISIASRTHQHGPDGGVGQTSNAQDLNLNRDYTKLETPEVRSLVRLFQEYDPHVVIDLRTTNGSPIAYNLGYSPPLNPNTDSGIVSLLEEDWFPTFSTAVKGKYGWESYFYGTLGGAGQERGWYTFDHRPRFAPNYVGLRNRVGLMGIVYAYLSFEERIVATQRLLEEMIDYAATNAERIRQLTAEADSRSVAGQALGLRAAVAKSADEVEILLSEVEEVRHPYTGRTTRRRRDVIKPERMPVYGKFTATESERAPQAYFVPARLAAVIERLEAHGVRMSSLPEAQKETVEQFRIVSTSTAEQAFQGHKERTVTGRYEKVELTLPAGTRMVPVDQPLGRLAFYLLEPRSDDGFLNWNLLDDLVKDGDALPIVRRP